MLTAREAIGSLVARLLGTQAFPRTWTNPSSKQKKTPKPTPIKISHGTVAKGYGERVSNHLQPLTILGPLVLTADLLLLLRGEIIRNVERLPDLLW